MISPERSTRDSERPMGRLVLVCDVFYPDTQSTSQLFSAMLRSDCIRHSSILVLTNHPSGSRRAAHRPNAPEPPVEIKRVGLRIDAKKSLASRLVRNAAFLAHATLTLAMRRNEHILGLTNPPFTPVWLWLLTRATRSRYDLYLLDIYPDGLAGLGMLQPQSMIFRLWSMLNRMALRGASRVVVLGRDMRELLRVRYGLDESSVVVFPHWSPFDREYAIPREESRARSDLGLQQRFVVHYSGNMGAWHDIDSLIRAAALLRDEPEVRFVFQGGGQRRAKAMALAEELGLSNCVTWCDFVPEDKLPDALAAADVAVISQRRELLGVAVPCKLYGILASGRAVLAAVPETSEVARVVSEEQCGVIVDPHDPAAIADAIRRLSRSRDEVAMMGERAHRAYIAKYTVDEAARTFGRTWHVASDDVGAGDPHAQTR